MSKILRVENICKSFGTDKNIVRVLNDVSFDVEKGDFVSIMGPSGCGKSTLLYVISALEKPDKGDVLLEDLSIIGLSDYKISKIRRKEFGFIFQFYNLVPNLTIEDNILLPVVMDNKNTKFYRGRLNKLLNIIGLEHKRKAYPNELSGGQQQRVSIARALIMNPKLLLADEPTGNLDAKSGQDIMELFKKINEELDTTIIQVTHSNEMALYGKRIIRMLDGKIIDISLK